MSPPSSLRPVARRAPSVVPPTPSSPAGARQLSAHLTRRFAPTYRGVTFQVHTTTERDGGTWVSVTWQDGPTDATVMLVTDAWVAPRRSAQGPAFALLRRVFSVAFLAPLVAEVARGLQVPAPRLRVTSTRGAWVDAGGFRALPPAARTPSAWQALEQAVWQRASQTAGPADALALDLAL